MKTKKPKKYSIIITILCNEICVVIAFQGTSGEVP